MTGVRLYLRLGKLKGCIYNDVYHPSLLENQAFYPLLAVDGYSFLNDMMGTTGLTWRYDKSQDRSSK